MNELLKPLSEITSAVWYSLLAAIGWLFLAALYIGCRRLWRLFRNNFKKFSDTAMGS